MAKLAFTSEQEYSGYLRVNSCGKNYLTERDYNTLREKGRIDYSAYYITKGVCYCHVDSKVIKADEGSVVLYFPRVRQHYSFKKEDKSEMLWAHFSGTACDIFKEVGLDGVCVIKIKDKKQFESAFKKMITAHYKKMQYFDTASQGYMTVLLSLIAQSSAPISERKTKISNENLEKVLSLMYETYNKPIDVKKYAALCFVGEDHFIRVFKAYTGITPYTYQLKIRIDRAAEMLENTAISVGECAEVVGFSDNAYFSKVFKRFTGHCPSYYKK
ncbi:MAG: helix-turn-helix transcriptional regulator [Oscillospiraceae bacterium]|nr:helix-turn-helix transcriptional regulator [Oscillospiraceae bacterium]